jgi:hypothetical protein
MFYSQNKDNLFKINLEILPTIFLLYKNNLVAKILFILRAFYLLNSTYHNVLFNKLFCLFRIPTFLQNFYFIYLTFQIFLFPFLIFFNFLYHQNILIPHSHLNNDLHLHLSLLKPIILHFLIQYYRLQYNLFLLFHHLNFANKKIDF